MKKNKERIKNYATERYHSGNGEKKAKWYCDYNKHRLPKQERNCYRNIPKEEIEKKESIKERETEIYLKKSKKI